MGGVFGGGGVRGMHMAGRSPGGGGGRSQVPVNIPLPKPTITTQPQTPPPPPHLPKPLRTVCAIPSDTPGVRRCRPRGGRF